MKNGKNTEVIILVASLLLAITFMDIWMVFETDKINAILKSEQ